MKKLLFAIAGAAAFAAMATDYDVLGFETFNLTSYPDGVVANKTDTGAEGTPYRWVCAGDDASAVKAYDAEFQAPNITGPAQITGTNAQYLNLDTNGSELKRNIKDDGTAQALNAPLYIDTLVQFTPSESAPSVEDLDGAKLAIWLSSENGVTNLCVRGLQYSDSEISVSAPVTYAITNVIPQPGTWYRLTVKAVPAVLSVYGMVSAFTVAIDGVDAVADKCLLIDGAWDTIEGDEGGICTAEEKALIKANKVFGAMADLSQTGLTSVGFKGTGALDDFVVTDVAPDNFGPAGIDFTLTWPAGLTAVSYTIDGGEPVAISGASPLSIPNLVGGEAITFIVQNADGAQKTLSATAADGEGIDATGTTFGWPEYLGDAVSGAYQIDDFADLDMLRKGVAAGLATVGETFNQTANIDMSSAGPFAGIGTYNANLNNGVAFCGTYDGQGYKISNIDFTQRNYGGIFNQVKGGTIKNLTVDTITCSTFDSSANSGEWGSSIIGNVGLGSTVQNLTAMGSFGSAGTPCTHNVAGIAIRVCGGASNVVNGVIMLETLVKDCTNNATLYGSYTKCGGMTALTQDQNGVPNDYVLYDGCVNNANIAMVAGKGTEGRDGLSGILGYVSDGTKIKDCVNNGTLTSVLATAKIGGIVGWAQGRFLDDLGGNKNPAAAKMVGDPAGSTITGFTYATVDDGVATTVDAALAAGNTYLLEGNAAPVFAFAAAGTIAFDTALGYTLDGTGITADQSLTLTDETVGTVTTYTAAGQGGDDYVVEIDGSDVTITPTDEDLAALAAAGVDTNSVAAVNEALATPIPGGDGVLAWQAAFLGVEPTTNGLKQVAIKSVSFDAEGKVVVEMADGVTLKTGRGVTINLILKGSDDLSTWTTLQTATDSKAFTPVTPALGETKKFYKVVVEFAGSSAQP